MKQITPIFLEGESPTLKYWNRWLRFSQLLNPIVTPLVFSCLNGFACSHSTNVGDQENNIAPLMLFNFLSKQNCSWTRSYFNSWNFRKQTSIDFPMSRCSENMRQIYTRTESDFNKVAIHLVYIIVYFKLIHLVYCTVVS